MKKQVLTQTEEGTETTLENDSEDSRESDITDEAAHPEPENSRIPTTGKRKQYRPRGERWQSLPSPMSTRKRVPPQANIISSSCLMISGDPKTVKEALTNL
jgi:hypothetical protein